MTEPFLEILERIFFAACGFALGFATWNYDPQRHIALLVTTVVFFLTSARVRRRMSRGSLVEGLGSRRVDEHLRRTLRRTAVLPLCLVAGSALSYIFANQLQFRVSEVSVPLGTTALLGLQLAGLGVPWPWRARDRLSPVSTTPLTDAFTWSVRLSLVGWTLVALGQTVLVGFVIAPVGIAIAAVLRLAIADRQEPVSLVSPRSVAWFYVSFTKGWLLTTAIFERHLSALAIGISVPLLGYYFGDAANGARPKALALLISGGSFWLVPVVRDLLALDDSLYWAYANRMRQIMRSLNHHVVVLGVGDLGRRFLRTMFTSDVLVYGSFEDNRLFSTNVLLPNGHLAKVMTRVAAVELSESRVSGVARQSGGPGLAWLDLNAAILKGDQLNLVDYVLPVVIGDAMNADIQQVAAIERAQFVASLLPDSKEELRSQSIVNTLHSIARRGRPVPAVVAIHSSTYIPYITEKRLRFSLPLHFIYPAHLEGLNAGTLTHAAFVSWQASTNERRSSPVPRVLLCGTGKRVTYLMDSLLKCFSAAELNALQDNVHADGGPIFSLLSPDPDLATLAATEPDEGGVEATFWKTLPQRLAVSIIKVSRFVSRSSPSAGDVNGHLALRWIDGDAADYLTAQAVLQRLKPDIVVISHQKADEAFRAINAIGTNITRLKLTPPLLLVSGETGRLHFIDYFDRALRYYSSTVATAPREWRYPIPWMPPLNTDEFGHTRDAGIATVDRQPLIDVLDDSIERLIGLVRIYLDPAADAVPVELNFCAPDRPGMLATTLAGLAGYRPRQDSNVPPISVANTRLIARANDSFIVRGYGYLQPNLAARVPLSRAGFQRAAIVAGLEPYEKHPAGIRAALINCVSDACDGLKPAKTVPTVLSTQATSCCGMPTCPIEGFNKVGLAVAHTASMQGRTVTPSLNSLNDRFIVTEDVEWVQPPERDDRPFAHFSIRCTGESLTGSCAAAVCAFLQIPLDRIDEGPMRTTINTNERDDRIFSVRYLTSYECHDEGRGLFTVYGERVKRRGILEKRAAALHLDAVIQAIEIWPIRDADRRSPDGDFRTWSDYAQDLTIFLNRETADGTYECKPGEHGAYVVCRRQRGHGVPALGASTLHPSVSSGSAAGEPLIAGR